MHDVPSVEECLSILSYQLDFASEKMVFELGLTRPAAAKALGMSGRTITTFANCEGPVPRRIELAIKGLLAECQVKVDERSR